MTVASPQAHALYVADGTTTAFPVPFAVQRPEEVAVALSQADGSEELLAAGAGWAAEPGWVRFATPPAAGRRVAILRAAPLIQDTALVEYDRFFARTLENAFDRLVTQIQQTAERVDRALVTPASSSTRGAGVTAPVAGGLLRWADDLSRIETDAELGAKLVDARDQAMDAAQRAEIAAALADAARAAALDAAARARLAADRSEGAAAVSIAAADRAEAAEAVVALSAQRASWALGLMGLANNLTQLLYVVTPFLGRLFGIFKDFGWVVDKTVASADLGWVCPPADGGDCEDWGALTAAPSVVDWGGLAAGMADTVEAGVEDWGLISVRAFCAEPALCTDDLGWINAVIDVSSTQPIELPIRVPDPCPVLIRVKPSTPAGSMPDAGPGAC